MSENLPVVRKCTPSHYLEARLEDEDAAFLHTQLLLAAHSLMGKNEDVAIGITFPEWRVQPDTANGNPVGHLGSIMRFFGKKDDLEALLRTRSFAAARTNQMAQVSAIRATPEAEAGIAFYRLRTGEKKHSPSAQRRLERRSTFSQGASEKQRKAYQPLAVIGLSSVTTGQRYGLRVSARPESLPSQAAELCSFGLCRQGSALPAF